MGIKVTQKPRQEILDGFNTESYSTIECRKEDLSQLKMPSRSKRILISDSFHRVDMGWLMLSDHVESELTELELAAITEGVAAAIGQNDRYYLEQEQAGLEHIYGMTNQVEPCSYGVFTSYTEETLQSSARYSNMWNWELYSAVKDLLYT